MTGPDRKFRNTIPTSGTAAPGPHTHAASDTTSLVFSSARLGSGTANSTKYLRGDGSWQTLDSSHVHGGGDITTGTVAPARLGSGSPSSSNFLRGDGSWQTVSGTPGPTGLPPGTALFFDTTTTMAAPGSFTVRFNNATPSSATAIAISTAGLFGANLKPWLLTCLGSHITFGEQGPHQWLFQVTAITDNTTWLQLTVAPVFCDVQPTNAQLVFVNLAPHGSTGDVVGPASAVNLSLTVFDGTTGKLVKDGGVLLSALATTSAVAAGYQPLDSDLTAVAGLTATTGNVIQSVGSSWASRTMAQFKVTLAMVVADISDFVSAVASAITTERSAARSLTNANLNSGTNTFPTFNQSTTGSAATLTTSRTIGTLTGDVTSTGSGFNGSAANTNATVLAASGVAAATYGDASHSVTVTFDAKGRATSASAPAIALAASAITSGTVATARLGSGTASASTFLAGDQTYKVPTGIVMGFKYTFIGYIDGNTPAAGEMVYSDTGYADDGIAIHSIDADGNDWGALIDASATTGTVMVVDASGRRVAGARISSPGSGGDIHAFSTANPMDMSAWPTSSTVWVLF